jgi:hypothetical protein
MALGAITLYCVVLTEINIKSVWHQNVEESEVTKTLTFAKWGLKIAENLLLAVVVLLLTCDETLIFMESQSRKFNILLDYLKYIGLSCCSIGAVSGANRAGYYHFLGPNNVYESIDAGGLFQYLILALCLIAMFMYHLVVSSSRISRPAAVFGVFVQIIRFVSGIWLILFSENRVITQVLMTASFFGHAMFLLLWISGKTKIFSFFSKDSVVTNSRVQNRGRRTFEFEGSLACVSQCLESKGHHVPNS